MHASATFSYSTSPRYHKLLALADCVVNIAPQLDTKRDILRNALGVLRALGVKGPKVGIVAAVETVNPSIQVTLDAHALAQAVWNDAIVEGPFGFDNAISADAARVKGMNSRVAGDADLLLMPDLNAANMLYKSFTYIGGGECAGLVLGARVPDDRLSDTCRIPVERRVVRVRPRSVVPFETMVAVPGLVGDRRNHALARPVKHVVYQHFPLLVAAGNRFDLDFHHVAHSEPSMEAFRAILDVGNARLSPRLDEQRQALHRSALIASKDFRQRILLIFGRARVEIDSRVEIAVNHKAGYVIDHRDVQVIEYHVPVSTRVDVEQAYNVAVTQRRRRERAAMLGMAWTEKTRTHKIAVAVLEVLATQVPIHCSL